MIKYWDFDYQIKGIVGDRVVLEPVSYKQNTKACLEGRRINPSFKVIKNRNGVSIQINGKRIRITEELNQFFNKFMEV